VIAAPTDHLTLPVRTMSAPPAVAAPDDGFGRVLRDAAAGARPGPGLDEPADPGAAARIEAAREAAIGLVGTALIKPVFDAMREGSMAEGPFAPGDAERRFMPMLHQHLTDRIVGGQGLDLVDRIVDDLTGRTSPADDAPEAPDDGTDR